MPPTGRHPSARPTAGEAWPSPDEPYAAACPDNAGDTAAWRVRTRRTPGRHAVRRRAGAHRTPPGPPSTHESSTVEGRAPFVVSTMAGNPCHPGRLSDAVRQGMRLSPGLLGRRASPSAPLPLWREVGFPSARPHARVDEPQGFLPRRVFGFALVEHHRTGFIPLADTTPLGDPTGDLPPPVFRAGFSQLSGLGDGEDTLELAYRIQRVQPVIRLTA